MPAPTLVNDPEPVSTLLARMLPAAVPPVTSLTLRRLAALPPDTRPLPSVAAYDQLLRRPPRAATPSQGDQS